MEADSRVSPVSALKAKPRTVIRYRTTVISTTPYGYAVGGRRANLVGDGVKQGINNVLRKSPLLVLVHLHHLPPIGSDLGQMQALAQIHQVQDILLETRSTETDGGFQEFGADT